MVLTLSQLFNAPTQLDFKFEWCEGLSGHASYHWSRVAYYMNREPFPYSMETGDAAIIVVPRSDSGNGSSNETCFTPMFNNINIIGVVL